MRDLMEKSYAVIAEHGLTASQYTMLIQLQKNPKVTQQALAEKLGVTKGNVSQMIKILERDGLVVRQQDGAAYRVRVTQKAINKIEMIIPEHDQHIARLMSKLDKQDIQNLQHIISKFAQVLYE